MVHPRVSIFCILLLAVILSSCVSPPTADELVPAKTGARKKPIGEATLVVSIAKAGPSEEWSDEAYSEALRRALVDANVFVLAESNSPYRLEVEVMQVDSYFVSGLTAGVRIHSAWTLYRDESRVVCKLFSTEGRGQGDIVMETTRKSLARGVKALVYYPPGNPGLPSIQTRLSSADTSDVASSHWSRIFEAIVAERLSATGRFRSVTTATQGDCGEADYTVSLDVTRLEEQAVQGKLIADGAKLESTFRLDGAIEGVMVPTSPAAHRDALSYIERKSDYTTLAVDRTAKVVVERVLYAIASRGSK